jgi:hypothetical protein
MQHKASKWLIFTVCLSILQAASLIQTPDGLCQQKATPLTVTKSGLAKLAEFIDTKKIDSEWGHSFSSVTVSLRNIKGFAEYVLIFKSQSGSPETVTLFYNMNGGYSGSNLDN